MARDTNDQDSDSNTNEYRTYTVHEGFQDTVWGLSDSSAASIEGYLYTDPYGACVVTVRRTAPFRS
jgi:hypothetical protein